MKNIKVFFLSLIGVFLFYSALYGQDNILNSFIYTYDDFDGNIIDRSLWDYSDPYEVASVSGGFLHVSTPPNLVWLHLNSPHKLYGDFGIMVSFQNFISDDEFGSLNNYDPSITLMASWNDSGTLYQAFVGREYQGAALDGHVFFSAYDPGSDGQLVSTTSAVGKLFILRRGSTFQMGYNDGTQTVVLQTYEGGWTGEVSFVLIFGTGYTVGSNFNIDVDYVKSDHLLSTTTTVDIDIKPGSCPNPLNTKSKGNLPVAILGTEEFDVTQVDPASVLLEGVSPLSWALEDVATPFEPFQGKEDCFEDCNDFGPDGYMDLTVKFDKQEVVAAFGGVYDGDCMVLSLTGNLLEDFTGTPIVGEDVVLIREKK